MNTNLSKRIGLFTMAFGATLTAMAAPGIGMLLGYESVENDNPQESAAAKWFQTAYPDGVLITPSTLDRIDPSQLDAIWVHIDRCGIGAGFANLPEEFKGEATVKALSDFVKEGGSLYLSKFATQMVAPLGRIPDNFQPGIFGDGEGGQGFDDWCVNAFLGSWQVNPDNADPDPTQIYDRTGHAIYKDLLAFSPEEAGFPHPAFPMEGTGDPATSLHREDHNCMWDLNAYGFDAEGKNTLEKFEAQFDCQVIGTWGHVQDYCVAGIVDFAPAGDIKGRIVANGLAACEWAPRSGENAYQSNLELLTKNTIDYLASMGEGNGVGTVTPADGVSIAYYTIDGVKVDSPSKGLYIKVADGKATKVVIK